MKKYTAIFTKREVAENGKVRNHHLGEVQFFGRDDMSLYKLAFLRATRAQCEANVVEIYEE